MSATDVDRYLSEAAQPHAQTLTRLRTELLKLIPGGEECISYQMPCIKLSGKAVAGYAAFKNHLGYFPHSGNVIPKLKNELAGRKQTTGGFQFGVTEDLPVELLEKLVAIRIQELRERYPDLRFDVTK